MRVDLTEFYMKRAKFAMRNAASRLRRGLGEGGQPLAPKLQPNGKPLGGKLRHVLRKGKVSVSQEGFTVTYPTVAKKFDTGNPVQVERPLIDLTAEEEAEILNRAKREVVKQINMGVQ